MFLGDFISAVLLFGQFAVLRSRALLVLAGGYLFTGLVVVPYALTFPGAFAQTGLLGANLQSAALLFMAWHLGLPIAVTAYALLRDSRKAEIHEVRTPVAGGDLDSGFRGARPALAATWLAIHQRSLPSRRRGHDPAHARNASARHHGRAQHRRGDAAPRAAAFGAGPLAPRRVLRVGARLGPHVPHREPL
jgi:hypothetical protein